MTPASPDKLLGERERYLAASEALARVHAEELAAMTAEEALRKIRSLRLFGPAWRERPDWSGLVEQQAVFHRSKAS